MISVGDVYWYKRWYKFRVFTMNYSYAEIESIECSIRPHLVGDTMRVPLPSFEDKVKSGIYEKVES